jgi:hypothetical protein
VKLYGVASRDVNETVELFSTREKAEDALRSVVAEAPEVADDVFIEEIEIEEPIEN